MRANSVSDFDETVSTIRSVKVGANHISAVRLQPTANESGWIQCSTHHAGNELEFNYLASLPCDFFSSLCAIEVENSIAEQLKFARVIKDAIQVANAASLKEAA